jgi:hypothetical protein
MNRLRAFLRDHRRFAAMIFALALLAKALVPAGYMLASQAKVLTVEICGDPSGPKLTHAIVIGASGKGSQAPEHGADHAKADGACAFSALTWGAPAAADPALLALALAYILLLAFLPTARALPARPANLRPPLRGPPLRA